MSKYLQYFQLYSDDQKNTVFDTPVLCRHYDVVRLINYNLGKFPANGIGRVNIILTTNAANTAVTKRFGDVLEVFYYFDHSVEADEGILDGYKKLIEKLKYDNDWLLDAGLIVDGVKSMNFQVADYFSKMTWDNSKGCYYRLYFQKHDIGSLDLDVRIFNKENELLAGVTFVVIPCGIVIKDAADFFVGKHSWKDGKVLVCHSNKQDYWEISISGDVKFFYSRAEKGDPHGAYDLGLMLLAGKGVLQNREEAIKWLSKSASQKYLKAVKVLQDLKISS